MSRTTAYFHWHLRKEGVCVGSLLMKCFRKSTHEMEKLSLAHYFRCLSPWLLSSVAFGEAEHHMRIAGRKKQTHLT